MKRVLTFAFLAVAFGPAAAEEPPCQRRVMQGAKAVVCKVDAARQSVRTLWLDPKGAPYGSLHGISAAATTQTGPMLFAMNAGMYHRDLGPVGLYIENGRTLKAASTAGGPGNFHMKPNGVFYVRGKTIGVSETRRFLAGGGAADFATQSGPMLVIDGRLHPKFTPRGQSEKIRNGVGVSDGKTAWFVITEEPVTFTVFAKMFRDDLRAPNALFLDGSISSLYAPSVNRADGFMPVGPIVAGFAK